MPFQLLPLFLKCPDYDILCLFSLLKLVLLFHTCGKTFCLLLIKKTSLSSRRHWVTHLVFSEYHSSDKKSGFRARTTPRKPNVAATKVASSTKASCWITAARKWGSIFKQFVSHRLPHIGVPMWGRVLPCYALCLHNGQFIPMYCYFTYHSVPPTSQASKKGEKGPNRKKSYKGCITKFYVLCSWESLALIQNLFSLTLYIILTNKIIFPENQKGWEFRLPKRYFEAMGRLTKKENREKKWFEDGQFCKLHALVQGPCKTVLHKTWYLPWQSWVICSPQYSVCRLVKQEVMSCVL